MCETCGCSHDNGPKTLEVHKSILSANERQAKANKEHLNRLGTLAINMISSPGSGKTTLLERTIDELGREIRIGVIEGDIETERDAERIKAKGIPVVQITTGGACHLDAHLVHKGIRTLENQLADPALDLLFIENVGNLVCPAAFELGEHYRMVFLSVPEGSDKPIKYPKAFLSADIFVITKIDLLEFFDFSMEEAVDHALRLNPELKTMALSAKSGAGFDEWIRLLKQMISGKRP